MSLLESSPKRSVSLPEEGGFSAGSDMTAETGEPIAAEDCLGGEKTFVSLTDRILNLSSDSCSYLYPTECSESRVDVHSQEGRDGLHKYSKYRRSQIW